MPGQSLSMSEFPQIIVQCCKRYYKAVAGGFGEVSNNRLKSPRVSQVRRLSYTLVSGTRLDVSKHIGQNDHLTVDSLVYRPATLGTGRLPSGRVTWPVICISAI